MFSDTPHALGAVEKREKLQNFDCRTKRKKRKHDRKKPSLDVHMVDRRANQERTALPEVFFFLNTNTKSRCSTKELLHGQCSIDL